MICIILCQVNFTKYYSMCIINDIICLNIKLDGDILKKLSIILCALWMGFIFYNSSRPGLVSNSRSYKIVESIRNDKNALVGNKNLEKGKPSLLPNSSRDEKINLIIRKNAHAFEYCMLAIFASNILFLRGVKGKNALICIMFICLLFAVTDEYHQIFVAGRSSLVSDVLIDFGGSLIGLGLFYLGYYKIYAKLLIKKKEVV